MAALRGVAGHLTDCADDREALTAAREALARALDELERSYAVRRTALAAGDKRP